MAGFAFLGSWFVEERASPSNHFGELMTFRARNVLVPALQRKRSELVVVEERGFPFRRCMTLRAAWRLAGDGELPAVHIAVAAFALRRSGAVIHILQ